MRLNLGCGTLPLEGYTNVDSHADEADVKGDVRSLQFRDVEEVVMYHLLEHLERKDTIPTLNRVRSWMLNRATIAIEVPDMAAIMANPREAWVMDVYGSQEHEGEFHRNGFDAYSLAWVMRRAGFIDVEVEAFLSHHPMRAGMPCLLGRGTA